jgi:hypothetical protein
MVDPILISDDDEPPRFHGAFAIFNSKPRHCPAPNPDGKFVSLTSLPPSLLPFLNPLQCSLFYHKFDSEPLFGPIQLEFPFSRFYGQFKFPQNLIRSDLKAIAFCVNCGSPPNYFWPLRFLLTVNQKQIERPNPRYPKESAGFWLDVTKSLIAGTNSIYIDGHQPRGVGLYYFILQLFVSPNDRVLAEQVAQHPHVTVEEWTELFKMTTGGDSDVRIARNVLSLVCPLGLWKISCPVRGNRCLLLGCFDLETYLR